MKKLRKLFGVLIIILALVLLQLPVSEADAASTASDFLVDKDGVLTAYIGSSNTAIIPEGVVTIATDAFKNNAKLVSVALPTTLEKIEEYAFWNCTALSDINFGSGLNEIGDFAFANCPALVNVTLPGNITSIGIYAFEDDVNLKDITIPYQTSYIHESAFDGCYKLVIHAVEGSYAYKYAEDFYKRQREFPEYEDVADYDSNREDLITDTTPVVDVSGNDVITPTTPTEEDDKNPLASVHVVGNQGVLFLPSDVGTVYSGDNQPQIDPDNTGAGTGSGTGMDDNGTSENYASGLPKYTIVDGAIVADQAYYCSKALNYVVLPDTIKEIGQFAYARSSLSSIVLPEGLETISYGAFYHCDNLSYVTIPSTVTKVEPMAFTYTAWYDSFMNGSDDTVGDFLISGDVLVAYRGNAAGVTIPEGIRVIAAGVFAEHDEITAVNLPTTLKVIGEEAFLHCTKLSTVNLEYTSVEQILDRAFYGTNLGEGDGYLLPSTVYRIGINAFDSDVVIGYLGDAVHVQTHEVTAERLSNTEYRNNAYQDSNVTDVSSYAGNIGVNVTGPEGITASLMGADDYYYLYVEEIADSDKLTAAMNRAQSLIADRTLIAGPVYELELTDRSGIPITKLGKQALTVSIPVPAGLNGQQLVILTVDRNGQLEEIIPTYFRNEGSEELYLEFTTYHLSPFALYGTGEALNQDEIFTVAETASFAAAAPEETSNLQNLKNWAYKMRFRLIPAVILIICGILLIVLKTGGKKKSS